MSISQTREEEAVKKVLLALETGAMERWRSGDPMGWAEISAEDVTYVDPGLAKPVIGIQEYRSYLKQLEGKVYYQGSEFLDPQVVVQDDAAVLSYNYRSTGEQIEAGSPNQTLWNTTEVYFRRAGQWKIAHTHWSFVRHELPDALEMPVPVQMAQHDFEGVLGEIMALEKAAMERWRKGDPWGFIDLYAPDVSYFDTGTPQRINGFEALKAEMASREGKIFYDVMDFVDPSVQVCGDMAVLFYRFFSTLLYPDGSVSSRIPWNSTEVYIRIDGQWRIVHNHWSFIKGRKM